jgi:cytochrome c biogenesis protein CcdA
LIVIEGRDILNIEFLEKAYKPYCINLDMGNGSIIVFILHVVIGLYLLNITFSFIAIPELITKIDKWVIFIGGILVIIGGINFLRVSKKPRQNIR